jgi:type I restriction enzyme S subunit
MGSKKQSELPSGWVEKTLDEVFKITAGGDIEMENVRKNKYGEFKYPVYANASKNKGLYGFANKYRIDFDCVTLSGRGEIGIETNSTIGFDFY